MDEELFISSNETTTSELFQLIQKITVSISCVLSIIGSLLIIVAFLIIKESRSSARQILMNLSIADLVTALANLLGILINFERFYGTSVLDPNNVTTVVSVTCQTQAFVAQYGTNASILWTVWISLHVLLTIAFNRMWWLQSWLKRWPKVPKILLAGYYITSWVLPAGILIWLAVGGYLGFEPNVTPGWCTMKFKNGSITVVVGYTMYVYFAFIVLPIISVTTWLYLRILKKGNPQESLSRVTELKLALIPVVFIVLRIWGLIVDIFTFQVHDIALRVKFEHSLIGRILVIFKGIGDSSQGFVNSILFVWLTSSIRNKFVEVFMKCFSACKRKCCHQRGTSAADIAPLISETSPILNASMKARNSSLITQQPLMEASQDLTTSGLTLQVHQD